jgi:hypothetical protein
LLDLPLFRPHFNMSAVSSQMTATAAFTATVAEAAALLQSLVAGARGLETAFWTAVKADKGSALVSHYH